MLHGGGSALEDNEGFHGGGVAPKDSEELHGRGSAPEDCEELLVGELAKRPMRPTWATLAVWSSGQEVI